MLVKIRLIPADDAFAQGIKMRVNPGSVQRRDVDTHLVQAEDHAAEQGGDQHQGFTSRPMMDLVAPAGSTRGWSMGEPLSSLDR